MLLALLPLLLTLATPAHSPSRNVAVRVAGSHARQRTRRDSMGIGGAQWDDGEGSVSLIGVPASRATRIKLEDARAWLARELHDGAVQRLTLMAVEIERLKRWSGLGGELDQLQNGVRATLNDLRRLLYELRDEPAVDANFVAGVRELLSELSHAGVAPDLVVHGWPEELPFEVAANLRQICGEALVNVRRHSGASRVTVTLQALDGSLALTVADDGRGLGQSGAGFGLRGMAERAALLGGRVTLDSTSGVGTTVRCVVPRGGFL
ncbi:MAG TPA: ATP-binding protein [Candidatus Binatia bacterium]|nr:ATP-binding protein [Candidatus Binatia bacterium]